MKVQSWPDIGDERKSRKLRNGMYWLRRDWAYIIRVDENFPQMWTVTAIASCWKAKNKKTFFQEVKPSPKNISGIKQQKNY